MQVVPLFPLETMAVPGLRLPLRVFEPRYRDLVEDLLEQPAAQRVFGVVALRAGSETGGGPVTLFDVGTLVRLQRCARRPDGGFSIVTVGVARFRVVSLLTDPGTSYRQGRVETIPEDDGQDPSAVEAAQEVRHALQALNRGFGTPLEDLPEAPRVLSYMVLASAPLAYADRQELLEISSVTARLRREAQLLRRERALFKELGTVPVVSRWAQGSLN